MLSYFRYCFLNNVTCYNERLVQTCCFSRTSNKEKYLKVAVHIFLSYSGMQPESPRILCYKQRNYAKHARAAIVCVTLHSVINFFWETKHFFLVYFKGYTT